MMDELKPCPCGKTPTSIDVIGNDRDKWSFASGDCCGEWFIEFRSDYLMAKDPERQQLAIKAWNESPRGIKDLASE